MSTSVNPSGLIATHLAPAQDGTRDPGLWGQHTVSMPLESQGLSQGSRVGEGAGCWPGTSQDDSEGVRSFAGQAGA